MANSDLDCLHSIRTHAYVHDKAQAEFRFHYNFIKENLSKVGFLNRKKEICEDIYFIFPGQWRVSENSFPAEKFVREITHYFRFREPFVKFSFIMPGQSERENPYNLLIRGIEKLERHHTKDDITDVQKLIRTYGAGYSSLFSKRINKKLKRLDVLIENEPSLPAPKQVRAIRKNLISLYQVIRASYTVMRNWRSLIVELVANEGAEYYHAVLREFNILDEYCSTLFVDALGSVHVELAKSSFRKLEDQLGKDWTRLNFTLRSHLRLEKRYQIKRGFKLSSARNRFAKEYSLSRFRALKRHIWSVLYTDSHKTSRLEFSKHFGPAIAAGFAALWAFAANIFVILHYPDIIQGGGSLQTLLGANGVLAIAMVILAYVVKDRIKEVGRNVFRSFGKEAIDHSVEISYRNTSGKVLPICQIDETARYVAPSQLPMKVLDLMKKHSIDVDLNLAERSSVLKLERKLKIELNGMKDPSTPSSSLSDIIRVNFDRFQSIMGDPKKQMYLLDEEGEIISMRMPKVYYCDIVISTRSKSNSESGKPYYQYVRLVINKKGLIRSDVLDL